MVLLASWAAGLPSVRELPHAPPSEKLAGTPLITVVLAWNADSLELDEVGSAWIEKDERRSAVIDYLRTEVNARMGLGSDQVVVRLSRGLAVAEVREVHPGRRRSWKVTLAAADTLIVAGIDRLDSARPIRWNGKTWRGEVRVFLGTQGKLTMVQRVPREVSPEGTVRR
jgi:hypothetical protein